MIKDLQVQCEKDMMRVRILFDRPFYGMVFSKGHYSNINCVHVPSGLGQTQVSESLFLHFSTRLYDYYPYFPGNLWYIASKLRNVQFSKQCLRKSNSSGIFHWKHNYHSVRSIIARSLGPSKTTQMYMVSCKIMQKTL